MDLGLHIVLLVPLRGTREFVFLTPHLRSSTPSGIVVPVACTDNLHGPPLNAVSGLEIGMSTTTVVHTDNIVREEGGQCQGGVGLGSDRARVVAEVSS